MGYEVKIFFFLKKVRVSTILGLSILKNGSSIYQGKADVWRREGEASVVWDPPRGFPHSREPKKAEWTTDKKKKLWWATKN